MYFFSDFLKKTFISLKIIVKMMGGRDEAERE